MEDDLRSQQDRVTADVNQDVTQVQATGEEIVIPSFVARFVEQVPWNPVQSLRIRLDGIDPCDPGDPVPCEHQRERWGNEVAHPHWYVIGSWSSVDWGTFKHVSHVIDKLGYRARYVRPYNPRPLINRYLEIGEYVYWYVPPAQLCRTLIAWPQGREIIPVQETLDV